MSKVSKSPQRHTFQKEGYVERCAEKGEEPNQNYLDWFEKVLNEDDQWAEQSHPEDMEWCLRSTDWICEKARASDAYAQNLYAAMCNMQFQKLEVMPILKEELWSCSWRSAGGIVANMRQQGDYIDWYCSGIGDGLGNGDAEGVKGYVPEGVVTEEIREDLYKLGWIPVPWDDNDK